MRDFDQTVRTELSAALDAHPALDAGAFSARLAERKRKRMRSRVVTASAAALVILLATVASGSLDLAGKGSDLDPADPPAFEVATISVPGDLDHIAIDPVTKSVWILNRRGQIGRLQGEAVKFGTEAVQRSQSGWRTLAASEGTLWISRGRSLDRVDASGRVTGTTRLADYISHLEVGSGYVWALAGPSLTRVDPETLEQQTVALTWADELEDAFEDRLAAGFGAAWVGAGRAGVVRVDAETLKTKKLAIGPIESTAGKAAGYVYAVAVGEDEIWACCDEDRDVVALDARSERVTARFDLRGPGGFGPGGSLQMSFGNERLWVSKFGLYAGKSFTGLFGLDERSGTEGPFPLPGDYADALVATPDELLVEAGTDDDVPPRALYRLGYSDLDDLPYPAEPEKSKAPLWVFLGLIAGTVGLVFFLGREQHDDEDVV
jgi:hypothetical protein